MNEDQAFLSTFENFNFITDADLARERKMFMRFLRTVQQREANQAKKAKRKRERSARKINRRSK